MRLLLTVMLCIGATSRASSAQTFDRDPDHLTSRIQAEALDRPSLGLGERPPARVLMPLALEVIKDFEKWVPNAYNDASYFCTIGYGHLIAKSPCERIPAKVSAFSPPIDLPKGLELLDADTTLARQAVQGSVRVPLNDAQFGALASFVFNVGAASFAKSTLLRHVNNREFDEAAVQFGRWVKSKDRVLNGLVSRRACEAALFRGVLRLGADKRFHRRDCEALGVAPGVEELIDIDVGEAR